MKYHSLGRARRQTYHRLSFSEEISRLKRRLIYDLTALENFYKSLSACTIGRIEAILKDIYHDTPNTRDIHGVIKELVSEGTSAAEVQEY
jgi:hypothetical protein